MGRVELGTKCDIAYFDQMRETLDEEATLSDVISKGQDYIEFHGRRLHITTYLQDFLFEPARFQSQVKSLSGGERNRLLLARLFSKPANVLILDEPTNDLDIETLELLEELLENYTGTVFLVSHDRAFLDNVVTSSLVFTGNGKILELVGGYSDWLTYQQSKLNSNIQINGNYVDNIASANIKSNLTSNKAKNTNKLTYKEKLELENLPQIIDSLEREQKLLNEKLSDVDIYKNDPKGAIEYQNRINQIEGELINKLILWEDLSQKS